MRIGDISFRSGQKPPNCGTVHFDSFQTNADQILQTHSNFQ